MDIQNLFSTVKTTGISLNSQSLKKGDVFVALQGAKQHGIDFIDDAIKRGCTAVLTDGIDCSGSVPIRRIDNLKAQLPALANKFYPKAKKQKIIGITGTNGKTSVASFMAQILDGLGKSTKVIGTLNGKCTTPDIFSLYRILDDCAAEFVILEVSSHALEQGRVLGLNFIQAIFTNLTQDHLDYHQNMQNYLNAKSKLFAFDSLKNVVLNQDDENCQHFLKTAHNKYAIFYTIDDFSSIMPKEFGFLLQLEQFVFEVNLLGRFNLSNLLAALYGVCALGFDQQTVIPLLPKLNAPIGRIYKIPQHNIWIDFAHTPDALQNAIDTLKLHYPQHNINLVFGCGGNRDKNKRAKMGKIASNSCHTIILTNDNPRDENPLDIIEDIKMGVNNQNLQVITDRALAIEAAISNMAEMHKLGKQECVLIAGKGHENYQIIGDEVFAFSDLNTVNNLL